jgi:ABC-type spermidine/putrescine transport system permease subunit II
LVIAVALALWQTQLQYGWLEMALGGFAWAFWIAVIAWGTLTAAAIHRHRAWWLLITAPIVLYPVVMAIGLLASCARGDCF